jgi:hypothetical protein
MDVYFNAISCIEGYFSDMNLDIISNVSVGGVVNTLLSPYFLFLIFLLGKETFGNYPKEPKID